MSTTKIRPDTSDNAAINPRTGRPAGALQGILMLIGCTLPLLASVLLAPVLPSMAKQFASTPGVAVLVPLVLSAPGLFIAIGAPFAGRIADRIGRRRLLIGSLIVYGIFGTAPIYLVTLQQILISRIGVGIAEAGVMTCATAMLADYFVGTRRTKYMSLQTVVMALSATAFFVVGGALGSNGWRTPFWLYTVSAALAVLVGVFAWQPKKSHEVGTKATVRPALPPLPWRTLGPQMIVSALCGAAFYAIIVQLPFLLTQFGVTAPAQLGAVIAGTSLATAAGAISFRWIAKYGVGKLLPIGFGLSAAGLIVLWFAPSLAVVIVGAVLASAGAGLMFPTLLIWTLAPLDYEQRGRATGWWTGAVWLGQFASPLIIAAIQPAAGSLQGAVGILGIVTAVVTVILAIALRGSGGRVSLSTQRLQTTDAGARSH